MNKRTILFLIASCALLMLTGFKVNQKYKNTDKLSASSVYPEFIDYERMPSFVGGDVKLLEFLHQNLNKKIVGVQNLIPGRCHVTFEIDTLGKCNNFKVLKPYTQEVDSEFVRVLRLMPDWIPAKQYRNGSWQKTKIKYTIPLKLPFK